jgi:hypothetical protein
MIWPENGIGKMLKMIKLASPVAMAPTADP